MPCSQPIEVGRYVYDAKHGGRIKRYFLVPCGKCVSCLRARQMQFAFRAEWEALDPSNLTILFCTFTYSPENLLDNELSVRDVQHYIRRLRKSLPDTRVKYMFCGEYGELYGRKHYHGLLYFDKFIDYEVVAKNWPFGIVDIAPFTPARAGYVAKYSVKQLFSDVDEKHVIQPFLLVSRDFGFYFLHQHGDFCRRNYIFSWSNLSGMSVYLPRIFIERLWPPRDKVHTLKMFENDASFLYFTRFAGNSSNAKFHRRLAYDTRFSLQVSLSGLDSWIYEGKRQLGVSFSSLSQSQKIKSRVAYEIGRY